MTISGFEGRNEVRQGDMETKVHLQAPKDARNFFFLLTEVFLNGTGLTVVSGRI